MKLFETVRTIDWRRNWPLLFLSLFTAGSVAIPELMSASHALLLIAALLTVNWPRRALHRDETRLVAVLFSYWFYGLFSYFYGGMTELGQGVLDRDLRFLLAIPVIYLVTRVAWNPRLALRMLAVAGFLCGAMAIIEYWMNGMDSYRVSGSTVSIVFGNVCAAIAAINLGIAAASRGHRLMTIHFLAALSTVVALVLSGTRGAVLALAAAAVTVLLLLMILSRLRKRLLAGFFVVASAIAIGLISLDGLRSKALLGEIDEVSRALEGVGTSVQVDGYDWSRKAIDRFIDHSIGSMTFIEEKGYFRVDASDKVRRVRLPYRNVAEGTPLVMRVRGKATLIAADGGRHVINADDWQELVVQLSSKGRYPRVQLLVKKGSIFEFLPRISFAGEWQFTLFTGSVGTRIVMWEFVIDRDEFATPLGAGLGRFPEVARQGWQEGRLPYFATHYDHVHNDYINVLFERGILGLVLLIGIYLVPFAAFVRALRRPEVGPLALGGAAFVISMAVSGLTETMLIHSYSISFFAVMLAILVATLHNTTDPLPEKS